MRVWGLLTLIFAPLPDRFLQAQLNVSVILAKRPADDTVASVIPPAASLIATEAHRDGPCRGVVEIYSPHHANLRLSGSDNDRRGLPRGGDTL